MFKLKRFRKTTGLAVGVAAAAAAFGASAFTASNTVPAHLAGAGSAVITGYTVSNPLYTYNATGTSVTKVTFDLSAAASDVKAALTTTPVVADWQDCGASGASTPWLVTCTFTTPVPVANATKLSVIAVSSGTATVA